MGDLRQIARGLAICIVGMSKQGQESQTKKTKVDDAAFNGLSDIMSSSSGLMRAVDSADFQTVSTGQFSADSAPLPAVKGRTLKTTLVISIMDSATGGSKTISVARMRPCTDCKAGLGKKDCMRCAGEG